MVTSCGNQEETPDSTDEFVEDEQKRAAARSVSDAQKDFAVVFKDFIRAFQYKDYDKLNSFVDAEQGLFVIFPGNELYAEFSLYDNMKAVANAPAMDETLMYFEQSIQSGQIVDGNIFYTELDTLDACDITEIGLYGDEGATDVLSKTYQTLQDNTGEAADAEITKQIKACEAAVKIKVFVGVGSEAEGFYFTNKNDQWYLSIMDLSDCSEEALY